MAKPHKLKDGRYECQNCLAKFTRNAYTFKDPLFCSNRCRKEFHAQGGMSLKRLETKVRQWVQSELSASIQQRIDEVTGRVCDLEILTAPQPRQTWTLRRSSRP